MSNLPKDLPEIYIRALRRIRVEGNDHVPSAMFLWAAVAKRPLSIMEMRQAIAVRFGQTELSETQLITDVQSMISWCKGLLMMDEEDCILQFAHYSIKDFLRNLNENYESWELPSSGMPIDYLGIYSISKQIIDEIASEVCCTYLSYNTFNDQRVLGITSPKEQPLTANANLQPLNIAKTSIAILVFARKMYS